MCKMITKETGAQIEINSPKDQSITFVVSGKRQQVTEARRRILSAFQTQVELDTKKSIVWNLQDILYLLMTDCFNL